MVAYALTSLPPTVTVRGMTLADYLKENGLTQREFASRIGRSRSYVSMLLSGRKVPGLRTAKSIQDATGGQVSAFSLLDGERSERGG